MSAAHTDGRLTASGTIVYFASHGAFDIRNCPSPEANARRLAACWNACDGMPTERLEVGPSIADRISIAIAAGDNIDAELAKRTDELAAARALLAELIDIEGPQPGTAVWAQKVRTFLEPKP